jgi:hypothetical protein
MTRTEALNKAWNLQDATIEHIAELTGCIPEQLLTFIPTRTHLGSDHCSGWFAARTTDTEFNLKTNFPRYKGNLEFWLGVADGLMVD